MADVQVDNGFVRVASEYMEALMRVRLPEYEFRVLLAIMRRTWGYNQKSGLISARSLERATEIDHRHTQRALRGLVDRNMVLRVYRGERKTPELAIQKDFDLWNSGASMGARSPRASGASRGTPLGASDGARAGASDGATAYTIDKEHRQNAPADPPKPERKSRPKRRARSKPLTDTELEAAVLDRCERLRPWMLSETYKSKPQVPSWSWAWVLAEIDQAKLHANYATGKDPLGFVWNWICRDDAKEIAKAQAFGRVDGTPRKEPYLKRLALARADAEFVRENFSGPEHEPEPEAQTEVADLWT